MAELTSPPLAELDRFVASLPPAAQELILEQGSLGYLYELHHRVREFDDAVCGYGARRERERLFELLPPLS